MQFQQNYQQHNRIIANNGLMMNCDMNFNGSMLGSQNLVMDQDYRTSNFKSQNSYSNQVNDNKLMTTTGLVSINGMLKESCDMTLDQSITQEGGIDQPAHATSSSRRQQPNVMIENMKTLKTSPSPIRSNFKPDQNFGNSVTYHNSTSTNRVIAQESKPLQTISRQSQYVESYKDNILNTQLSNELRTPQQFQQNFVGNTFVHQSVLKDFDQQDDVDPNTQAYDFEQQLIAQLRIRNSNLHDKSPNQGIQLEQRFSKALRKYIKKEIHLALLSTQRVQKASNISELTLDSLLGKQATKDKFSCSSSLNYNQDNSIEEEILKEISTNLASKMDGLKPFFSNTSDQDCYGGLITPIKHQHDNDRNFQQMIGNNNYMSAQSANHVVNASDLDSWVKKADEYRELYIKAEMQLQLQQQKYEEQITIMATQYEHQLALMRDQLSKSNCQECKIAENLGNSINNNMLDQLQLFAQQNLSQFQLNDSRRTNWMVILKQLSMIPNLQQQLHDHMLQVQELQLNLEQAQIQMNGQLLGLGVNKLNGFQNLGSHKSLTSSQGSGLLNNGGAGHTMSNHNLMQQLRTSNHMTHQSDQDASQIQNGSLNSLQREAFNHQQTSDNQQKRIQQLENELKFLREEKETQELEIRHLKLVNNSNNASNSQSQRSLLSTQTMQKGLLHNK
eukprot:403339206